MMVSRWLPIAALTFILALFLMLSAGSAAAEGPGPVPVILYHEHLAAVQGQEAASGTYDVAFALYTAETGGDPLWSETQTGLAAKAGDLAASAGSVIPIPKQVLKQEPLWLAAGLRGAGQADFTWQPRQQVGPSDILGPARLPYAGQLSDASGQPLPDGSYDLTLALYQAAEGGEPRWNEAQPGVALQGGAFSVQLGSAAPLDQDAIDQGARWLEVTARRPGESAPVAQAARQKVTIPPPPHTPGPGEPPGDIPPAGAGGPGVADAPHMGYIFNIRVDAYPDENPAAAYNSRDRQFLVVWQERRSTTLWGVFGQRVALNGSLVGGIITIALGGAPSFDWEPSVAYSSYRNEYLVVYTHCYADCATPDYDVMGQFVQANGTLRDAAKIVDNAYERQSSPSVAYNSQAAHGQYLVAYQAETGHNTYVYTVVGRRLDENGYKLGSGPTTFGSGGGLSRQFPKVAYNARWDEYLVVYERLFPGDNNILGRRAFADLGTPDPEANICVDTWDQLNPAVSTGPVGVGSNNEYLVAWSDGSFGTFDYDIYARRVDDFGVPQGLSKGFDISYAGTNWRDYPAVAYDPSYGYLVAWEWNSGGSTSWDIYGRNVKPGQNAASEAEFVIDNSSQNQIRVDLACTWTATCLETEQDSWPSGASYEIRGRILSLPTHRSLAPGVRR